ncbi:DEAD/DEAH box helicase [Aneurinibacillus tyrosinisolvens]|uniref:DEAD/DEAH box helicase n=1 Tax=Aneurinibacillus tyrosinisolvens TaxID=1443435 RepID=UPI00063F3368|nr:AAA domain-containing protein [Aneurinibacillus tyrosinisolvens]
MNSVQNLLNYWYNLEFFSPFWPDVTKDTIHVNRQSTRLIWITNTDSKYTYDVYLGKIKSQDLIVRLLESINEEDNAIEQDISSSCVCAFRVASDGRYVGNSFSISTFVWAVAKIIAEKNLRTDFKTSEIDKLNSEINDILISISTPLQHKDLENIFSIVTGKIFLKLNDSAFCAVINRKFAKKENNKRKESSINQDEQVNEDSDIDTSTDMMSSFYVSDIDMVKRNIQTGDRIVQYIEALKKPAVNRTEIDTDICQMEKWLSPQKYPLGKWPSEHSPSLMQQIAINIAISENGYTGGIFSVNGPPGTGKTTLLKEVIASNVVERALLLSEYKKPDEAFKRCQFTAPENEYLKSYYQPDAKLNKFGVIVASNNNSAVENISKELPIAKDVKKANTKLFNIDETDETYFSDIAKTLTGNAEECWGLISARLGKKSNINELKQALWFNKEGVNLQELYKDELPDWEQAKQVFRNKHAEVIKYRKLIEEAVDKVNKHKQIVQERHDAFDRMSVAKSKLEEQQNLLDERVKKQNRLQQKLDIAQENVGLLQSRLPWFKRWFSFCFKKDPIIVEIKEAKQALDQVTINLARINSEVDNLKTRLEEVNDNYVSTQSYFAGKEELFLNSNKQLDSYKTQFGKNFAGEGFWTGIENNHNSQIACPWTDKKYDTLREELFYYALMLQKAFILNSKSIKQNMNCLVNMWSNKFSEQDKVLGFSPLLNTLFLVVPVVSTTFASVSTFLQYVGKNELGTLVIDEAGQATPHSAIGALWRTNKALIVGDPLQVEPVVTIPKELSKRFAEQFRIEDLYKPQELSVQVLADTINPYGGYREYTKGSIWLGCPLVVHRRCLDPMFSISNEVAYNNRMFKESKEADVNAVLLLSESVWIDITGREHGNKDHYVPEQGDRVIELVLESFALQKGFPDIYIISPFKSVANNMRSILKKTLYKHCRDYNKDDIDKWVDKSCGTVHTFQGKEANEVILMLGCDEKSGAGAAQWAGKKPNVLNVAVTRAKYRVAIIGDSKLWRKIPHFAFAYKTLCKD